MERQKLVRITTIPASLDKLLEGQLAFMNQYFEVIAVSSNEEALKIYGSKEGVRTFTVNMTRKITPFTDLKALWQMYCFMRREKPLIVHTHTPKAGLIGILAAYLAAVPHRLHTVAGLPLLEAKGFKRLVLNFIEKLTYAFATKVYPNSFGLQDIIIEEKYCNPQKIKVIANGSSNGIDTNHFNPLPFKGRKNLFRAQWGIGEQDFVFIFVGRLVSDKGINELITAFTDLYAKCQNTKLLLVGNYENELDPLNLSTLQKIRHSKNILTVGFQDDVRPFLSISDVFVFPSYREGFPNVILQALAMELPAVVTDINGCNELIQDNYNGLIVQSKNTEELRTQMSEVHSNRSLYKTLKDNTRKSLVGRKYERTSIWDAILEEYKQLIKK